MKYGKEIKIALVAIVGIVLLFFGMNFLKGANLFASGNQYYITFQDVSGLSASSPIFSNGYRVGTVKDIIFDYNQKEPVKVAVELDEKLQVPEGSSAAIVSDMLGNVQVNLLLADGKTMLSPGQVIDGQVAGGAMSKVAELVPAIERMLPKLDSILGSLNTVLADPSIPSSLHNIQTMTGDLTTSTKELNKLLASVNGQLPGMMTKADGVLDNAQQLTGNLSKVDVGQTMAKVEQTLADLQQFTQRLNSNKGTLGLMMSDPALYNNLNSTVKDADALMKDLKANPKRYVHFSVFDRKDKKSEKTIEGNKE